MPNAVVTLIAAAGLRAQRRRRIRARVGGRTRIPSPQPQSPIPCARSPGDEPLAYGIDLGVSIHVFRLSPLAFSLSSFASSEGE
jgi:hypothetical protein